MPDFVLLIIKREACRNPWISVNWLLSLMSLSVLFKSYDVAGFLWHGAGERRSMPRLTILTGEGESTGLHSSFHGNQQSRRPWYDCLCFGIQTSNYPALTPLRLGCGRQVGAGKLPLLCVLLGQDYGWWLLSNTGGNPAFRLHILQYSSGRETCDNQEKAHSICLSTSLEGLGRGHSPLCCGGLEAVFLFC